MGVADPLSAVGWCPNRSGRPEQACAVLERVARVNGSKVTIPLLHPEVPAQMPLAVCAVCGRPAPQERVLVRGMGAHLDCLFAHRWRKREATRSPGTSANVKTLPSRW
jgi:hypothetical protein